MTRRRKRYVGTFLGSMMTHLPVPGVLAFDWFVAYVVMSLAAGATVGYFYRPDGDDRRG